MSLINEALQRTRDATVQKAMVGQPDMSQYKLEQQARLPSKKQTRWLVTALSGIMLIGLAFFGAWKLLQPKPTVGTVAAPVVPPPPIMKLVEPVPVEKTLEPAPPKAPPVVTAPLEAVPVAPKVTPFLEPPKFALEGLTRDSEGFEALVNGASVRQGDEIDGAKVISIDSRTVRLNWRGQEIVLRMR